MSGPNVRLDVGSSIPGGYILGRAQGKGTGPAELLPVAAIGQALVAAGVVSPPGAGGSTNYYGRRIITSTQTYTPTTGVTSILATIIGAGGAGGGAAATSSTQQSEGAGGGAGGLAQKYMTSGFAGVTVTIGAAGVGGTGAGGNGGNSSFGAVLTANGGTGGGAGVTTDIGVAGGAGGTATGGDLNLTGRRGWFSSVLLNGGDAISGAGADAPLGLGSAGAAIQSSTTSAGSAGSGYGAGGSGAANGASQSAASGGNGAPGVCIIDEYGPATGGGGGGGGSGTVTSLSQGSGITLTPNPITSTGTIANAGVLSLSASHNLKVSASTGAVAIDTIGVDPPGADQDAVTWASIEGLRWKPTATCATTSALPAGTYINGTSGVGATFTVTATGVLTIDGHTIAVNDAILVKNQASGFQNGLYQCTTAGAVGVSAVLTRAPWNDDSNVGTTGYTQAIAAGDMVSVLLGTKNANTIWQQTTVGSGGSGVIVVGTDSLAYTQIASSSAASGGVSGLYSGAFTEVPDVSTFTVDNSASASNFTLKSGKNAIKITSNDTNGQIRGIYIAAPATPYHIEACMQAPFAASNFGYIGLYWSDGTKYLRNSVVAQGGTSPLQFILQSWTNTTTFSANILTYTPIQCGNTYFMRIGDDGTNYTFDISADGVNWLQLNTGLKSTSFLGSSGFTRVGFFGASQTGNTNVPCALVSWKQTS